MPLYATPAAVLISSGADFKAKNITRNKKSHFLKIKGPVPQEDITGLNMIQIDEARSDRTVRRNQIHNYIWRFQYLSPNN